MEQDFLPQIATSELEHTKYLARSREILSHWCRVRASAEQVTATSVRTALSTSYLGLATLLQIAKAALVLCPFYR